MSKTKSITITSIIGKKENKHSRFKVSFSPFGD